MQITIKTPFGESNFEMTSDKISALYNLAVKFATSASTGKEDPPQGDDPTTKEEVQAGKIKNVPHRRIDSLFGSSGAFRQETKSGENQKESEGYKGFLIIKCGECGRVKGFCAKTPISSCRCDCGAKTELHDLKRVFLSCKCGSAYKYKTNITDDKFEHNCLSCGSPVDLELNGRRNTYITIKD